MIECVRKANGKPGRRIVRLGHQDWQTWQEIEQELRIRGFRSRIIAAAAIIGSGMVMGLLPPIFSLGCFIELWLVIVLGSIIRFVWLLPLIQHQRLILSQYDTGDDRAIMVTGPVERINSVFI